MHHFTIKEASELSGLPESTLRYYETRNLIGPIRRNSSSGHRFYDDNDINAIIGIACLSATGMSIEDMREYLANSRNGAQFAEEQIRLLKAQKVHLAKEAEQIVFRQRYIDTKIDYWKATAAEKPIEVSDIAERARLIAKELRWPKKF